VILKDVPMHTAEVSPPIVKPGRICAEFVVGALYTIHLETAVQKGKTALRVDVANAVRRLWKVTADGRIPAWAPGTTGPLGTCLSEDIELRQLMEGV
jgi:hypothetical protein